MSVEGRVKLIYPGYHRFNFTFPLLGPNPVPIVIDTWNVFNNKGEISMYDATFKWWQWTVDYLLETAGNALGVSDTEKVVAFVREKLAGSICDTAMTYCNGTNAQYDSKESCNKFLGEEIRFGEAYELGKSPLLNQSSREEDLLRDVVYRKRYPSLPHGPPEHGLLPTRRPLLAHRSLGWRVLW